MKNIDCSSGFPKISIITPSYNQSQFIEQTIDSVLCQNYPNLEYIIIDGGSTDGTLEIIKKYEKYLYFWCSEPDQGQYHAINKGFNHSTGEIMGWLNSDDMYHGWAFKTVASIMKDFPTIEWLTTLQPGYWDYNDYCIGFDTIKGYDKEAFFDGCYLPIDKSAIGWIQQESTFWRRSIWERAGSCLNTNFKLAGDFELWCRFYVHGELYSVCSPLGGFRTQIHQKSRQLNEYIKEAIQALDKMRIDLDYKQNIGRSLSQTMKLNKIPKIKRIIIQLFGYNGKKIVRKSPDTSSGYWCIEKYKFL